jgi:hypothetical protein
MSCERLVCANCAGPVSEARCGVCQAGRERVHHSHPHLSPSLVVALTALLLALALLAERFAG